MDLISMDEMARFRDKYLKTPAKVLDCGSADAQNGQYGTYRDLFNGPGWDYVGLDIFPGPNVDLVVDPYDWGIENEYPVVISGQMLEHTPRPWVVMEQIAKAMAPRGIHCNIVPSQGPVHRHPVDCYRYLQDGMIALAEWAGLEVIECLARTNKPWENTVLIARKPA